tara:strand:- start:557 stop:1246 length:690 start_codon:yes stop_codon:yes gene_type:complete
MKLLIISAGPGIKEIKLQYGHAIDWISSFIDSSSIDIDVKSIYCNEDFDQSFYDGWIITGSAASVTDTHQWIELLKDKIIYASKNSIPTLGICFGHQIISSALGGQVTKNSKGWELGSYKISITDDGLVSPLFKGVDFDDYFYFSHEDIVSQLPDSAIELARNNMGLQAFSIENKIFGVQFHPEFSEQIMDRYVAVRYKRGIIDNYNPVFKSKSSYKIISNFIDIIKEL